METKKRPAAKGGKGAKTNKTNHVLNLLGGAALPPEEPSAAAPMPPASVPVSSTQPPQQETAAQEGAPQISDPQAAAPAVPSAQAAAPSLPILTVARNNNERLSETICAALEQALVEEESAQQTVNPPAAQGDAPEQTDSPADPESEPMSAAEPADPNASPAQETSSSEPEPVPKEAPKDPLILPGNALSLNVMELLVDEALQRYGKPTGLCQCPRCLADAKALALSRLPAKYTVLPMPAMPPMLSLYREEFRSDVLAQVLQACSVVKKNPRHPDPQT